MNYSVPAVSTNRGQTSIKYTGPKAWAEVPKELKDIAFRKPFSKRLKKHILSEIFEDLPKPKNKNKTDLRDLRLIFETEDEDDFLGFEPEINDLETLFLSDDEDTEFFGFSPVKNDLSNSKTETIDLETLFLSDNDDTEFLGFSPVSIDLAYLFSTDDNDEPEFHGF